MTGFFFTGMVFVWAYAIVMTKKLHNSNSIQINFHQGILILFSSAFAYSFSNNNIDKKRMIIALFFSGIPGVFGQLCFIRGLTLSKKTGILTMLNFFCVIWAYLISIFKYGESQNVFCSMGVLLAIAGVGTALFSKGD